MLLLLDRQQDEEILTGDFVRSERRGVAIQNRSAAAHRQTAAGDEGKGHSAMPAQPRKLSEIMKEMSETLLRNPGGVPSSEAAHVALFFANVAWNESVGLDHAREGYRNVWETIEAENPALWNEFKSSDVNAMIDELIR